MKKFYRYIIRITGDEYYQLQIVEIVYLGIRETPKGWWIAHPEGYSIRRNKRGEYFYDKWIPKESKSRFAYPTREEAMFNLLKRTEKRRMYAMNRVNLCDEAIEIIKERLKK